MPTRPPATADAPRYLKRYRMEAALPRGSFAALAEPALPAGYEWRPWSASLLEAHARAKAACFRGELDTQIFPSLGHLEGCRNLMRVIAASDEFCPDATWLIVRADGEPVGTVQGLADRAFGAIQNLGLAPGARGLGLGRALLVQALRGFARRRLRKAYLEVTAENAAAVRLYRQHGFRNVRTLYKPVAVSLELHALPDPLAPVAVDGPA